MEFGYQGSCCCQTIAAVKVVLVVESAVDSIVKELKCLLMRKYSMLLAIVVAFDLV